MRFIAFRARNERVACGYYSHSWDKDTTRIGYYCWLETGGPAACGYPLLLAGTIEYLKHAWPGLARRKGPYSSLVGLALRGRSTTRKHRCPTFFLSDATHFLYFADTIPILRTAGDLHHSTLNHIRLALAQASTV